MKEFKVAIVNYGMGNLFSVKQACEKAGMQGIITYSEEDILSADAVILPGVGAFGDAMEDLRRLNLIDVLKKVAESGKPLLGICLGMQLLMDESSEFGNHKGLGIIKGTVNHFGSPQGTSGGILKVPHIGWNNIHAPGGSKVWNDSILQDIKEGEFMYFVHSFYVEPEVETIVSSVSRYGNREFCSSFQLNNVIACQFHPERSSAQGLKVYENLRAVIDKNN